MCRCILAMRVKQILFSVKCDCINNCARPVTGRCCVIVIVIVIAKKERINYEAGENFLYENNLGGFSFETVHFWINHPPPPPTSEVMNDRSLTRLLHIKMFNMTIRLSKNVRT